MPLQKGLVIGKHYKVLRKIGEGQFAEVYEVEHRGREEKVSSQRFINFCNWWRRLFTFSTTICAAPKHKMYYAVRSEDRQKYRCQNGEAGGQGPALLTGLSASVLCP